jgi:hypothetical protein
MGAEGDGGMGSEGSEAGRGGRVGVAKFGFEDSSNRYLFPGPER